MIQPEGNSCFEAQMELERMPETTNAYETGEAFVQRVAEQEDCGSSRHGLWRKSCYGA